MASTCCWSCRRAAGADGLAALGDECAAAGVCLMIGGTLRFLPSQQVLKQRLDSGKLGELGLLRAHRWHAAASTGTGAAPAWQALAAPYLDLANWLFDDRPERVWARTAGPGYAQIHLGFRAGGMALIDVSAGLPPGDGYQSVSVIGSAGAGYADDHHNRALLFGGGDPAARNSGEGNHDLVGELAEFTAASAARRAAQVTASDAGAALLVAEAAAASAANGTVLERRGIAMSNTIYRCAALSAVKHDYLPRAVHAHPCFEVVVVADDPQVPEWAHERNAGFAAELGVPYVRDVAAALADYGVQVAVVSSEAERHCDLSARAAGAGMHVIQDKPMSTTLAECDRLVAGGARCRRPLSAVEPQHAAGAHSGAVRSWRAARSATCAPSTSTSTSPRTPGRRRAAASPAFRRSTGWRGNWRRTPTAPTAASPMRRWANCRSRASIRSATSMRSPAAAYGAYSPAPPPTSTRPTPTTTWTIWPR